MSHEEERVKTRDEGFDEPPRERAIEVPSTGEPTAEEKQWGMFCHLSVLGGFLVGGLFFVGPLICWLIKKDTSKYVDYHGKEALNFGISLFIYVLVSAVLSGFLIGIPLLIAAMVFGVVMPIIAGMKANEGQDYKYQYIFRIIQ
jgi:uncharacterized protein